MLKTLTITVICLFSLYTGSAQTNQHLDLGKIKKYSSVLNNLTFHADYSKKASVDEILTLPFYDTVITTPFNPTNPDAHYFVKLAVYNSGPTDSFWLYMGRAQQYTMYEYDSSTGKMKLLDNQASIFSYVLFNQMPYAAFAVKNNESKTFFIQININNQNSQLFDPIIIVPEYITAFTFDYFLQPNRIYLFISVLLLGMMFSLFFSFVSVYLLTFNRNYLYYTLSLLCYLTFFFLRIFDNFIFSSAYWYFYDASLQMLQIGGSIFILIFVSSFLRIRYTIPDLYKYFRIIIFLQVLFIAVNIPLTYSVSYHSAGIISFNVLRIMILPYFILLIAGIIKHIKTRESRYITLGSLISILLFLTALYADGISTYKSEVIGHKQIALLAFTTGILVQMTFFLQAILYRTKTTTDLRTRALEKLQLENDRKELEKHKAIMAERDKERNRISQEIHDDIGSGLTTIRLLSEIAKTNNLRTTGKELDKISATSDVLIDKMNEIVWSLNSRNDTLPNLIAYLRHLMVEYLEPFPVQLAIAMPENIPEIAVDGKTRRNILLSVKEVLHNIVKHARATEVHIIIQTGAVFSVSISDNGTGFHPSPVSGYKNGLRNINERMTAIGGTCEITSCNGTAVLLTMPLQQYPI